MDTKHAQVEANGISLHVVAAGAGPAVLFVHGFPDTWRGWRRQMEAVVAAGHCAISLDMRGYGESAKPEDASSYTVFQCVGDLVPLHRGFDRLRWATPILHQSPRSWRYRGKRAPAWLGPFGW